VKKSYAAVGLMNFATCTEAYSASQLLEIAIHEIRAIEVPEAYERRNNFIAARLNIAAAIRALRAERNDCAAYVQPPWRFSANVHKLYSSA